MEKENKNDSLLNPDIESAMCLDGEDVNNCSITENQLQTGKRIVLTQLNGLGYCFNADDYMRIRTEHRIAGSFMGASHLKGYTLKNQMLPVEFNEYETKLLLEENIAILVSKKKAFDEGPSAEQEEKLLQQIEKRMEEQEQVLNAKKIQETIKNISKVMAGKRKKLLQSGIPEKDIKLSEEQIVEEMKSNIKFDRKNAQLEIPNQCLYDHEGKIADFEVGDRVGYKIFRDIWKRGKVYVTLGGNFGGNFLIYPGDPLAFHASHVVHVLETPQIHPLNLIAKCRLSVTVNKLCVVAHINANDCIHYQTVQWEGSKDKHYNLEIKSNKQQNCSKYDSDGDS